MTTRPVPPDDSVSRRTAQTEFERPVLVEAGAGTGKTTVLVNRLLVWCLGPGWEELAGADEAKPNGDDKTAERVLERIVAITFTEAAAAQMAERLAASLSQTARGDWPVITGFELSMLPHRDPERLNRRAQALRGALDRLDIRTIHSYCFHLLTTYPLAAGLAPELRVDADGRLVDEVVREVVEAGVKEAYSGSPDHPLFRLARPEIDPQRLAETTSQLVREGLRAEDLARDPLGAEERTGLRQRLLSTHESLVIHSEPLRSQSRAPKAREVAELAKQLREALASTPEQLDLESLERLIARCRDAWSGTNRNRLRDWSRRKLANSEEESLGNGVQPLAAAAHELSRLLDFLERWDPRLLNISRSGLQPLVARVESELKARGIVTFDALLSEARRLLSERPGVLRRERLRIRQLLVDEFQDTDRRQCELVRLLALTGAEDERPSLFVVGDPKQSIYGWRDADLEAYDSFLDDLRAAGGQLITLRRNFRSVPTILEEVRRVIGPVMSPEKGLQPAFEPLEACAELRAATGFSRDEWRPIEYWVSWHLEDSDEPRTGAATRNQEAVRLEARAIARDIRRLHEQGGVDWGDCGLLLRSMSQLETFLESFRRQEVPFVVARDKQYFRRREVIEAAALVRAIVNPVDHLAMVAFLRSAIAGVPDAALVPLWCHSLPALLTELRAPEPDALARLRSIVHEVAARMPDEVPGLASISGWEISASAAIESLAVLRQAFETETPDRFIELLRGRFLLDVTEAARYLGRYRLANLDRFFRRLEEALDEQGGDIQAILRALRRSVTEAEEAEEAQPLDAAEDAVQVMTIHRAKGLEFRHLYVVQLHAETAADRWPDLEVHSDWTDKRPVEYVLFGAPTPGIDRVHQRQRRVALAEQVRTLYVALTRARERLVLVGKWPESPVPGSPEARKTYMDLLQGRGGLPESITDLLEECRQRGTTWVDAGGARWRFPGLEADGAPAPPRQRFAAASLTEERIAADSATLEAHRVTAAVRMARPFSSAASSEAAVRLRRLVGEQPADAADRPRRDSALVVGEAFHRMLETWRLDGDPSDELLRLAKTALAQIESMLPAEDVTAASQRFEELVTRFRGGKLISRFTSLAQHVVARELPVVLPAGPSESGPVAFTTGSIDLLYRDPENGGLVIADYKTDLVDQDDAIASRATAYQEQEALYARALHEALALDEWPRCQLWFIWPDRLWENPPARI